MTILRLFTHTTVMACLLLAGVLSGTTNAAESSLKVGAACATVNPPDAVYMAGYDLNRKSTGVHDDLFVKAVAFENAREAVILVVVDAISLQYPTVQQIRVAGAEALKKDGVTPNRIFVQATHTHCAPDTIGIYGADQEHSGIHPDYMKKLVQCSADQISRAWAARKSAKLVWAATECKGWAVNDSEPEVLDNSVTVLQALDTDGKSIVTLTNFACHPTVLDGDNTLISADWVGTFYKQMAQAIPGDHLFLQGGIGGWIQPKTPERTFALAQQYGTDLAAKTLAALADAKPVQGTAIRSASKVFHLPMTNPDFIALAESGLLARNFSNQRVETEVAWFSIGNAQFATHCGETAPDFSKETRALMDTEPKFVLGLGMDHLGYIVPIRFFDQPKNIPYAEYQITMSPGREAGKAMMDALTAIIP